MILKQTVKVIMKNTYKTAKIFQPLNAYGCRFGELTHIAFIIV